MSDASSYTAEEALTIAEHRVWRCREIAGRTPYEATRLECEHEAARWEAQAARLRTLIARQSIRAVDDDPDA